VKLEAFIRRYLLDAPPADGAAAPSGQNTAQSVALEPSMFARRLRAGLLAAELGLTSKLLFDRLAAEDVAEVERRIEASDELRDLYRSELPPVSRRHLVLAFGMYLDAQSVLEKTNLRLIDPPEDVHAMSRGPMAMAGGLYEADMVADALASASVQIESLRGALDFGCSSGRVVSVMGAAYPELEWHGCDPNTDAIDWASENLPGIDFFASSDHPPLPLEDASLGLVLAISIWSHFEPHLGLAWFDEMHRLIRPGGCLVMTTHGPTSVDFYATRGFRLPEQSRQILDALYRDGHWYAAEFGQQGDWGVVNPSWGTAFLSPEWLLAQLCPRWRVLEYAPGRNQENQDVYVLQRV
jgi:SAM-dependent methyltransferase